VVEALTPASPDSLPPLGELIADEPFWQYPASLTAGAGVAHLRVWLTGDPEPGHLAVVTETGSAATLRWPATHNISPRSSRRSSPPGPQKTPEPPTRRRAGRTDGRDARAASAHSRSDGPPIMRARPPHYQGHAPRLRMR
jgi:hypothetical protein